MDDVGRMPVTSFGFQKLAEFVKAATQSSSEEDDGCVTLTKATNVGKRFNPSV